MALTMTGTGAQSRISPNKQTSGGFIPTDPKVAFGPGGGQISPDPTTAAAQAASITVVP